MTKKTIAHLQSGLREGQQNILLPSQLAAENRASEELPSRQRGFTLIELLIVIAIIGLLAAIAIPQFVIYRSRGVDAQMKSDLRNAAVAVESYFVTNHVYPTSVGVISTLGFQGTQGVALSLSNVTPNSYQLTATKPGGTQPSYTFDSTTGSIQ